MKISEEIKALAPSILADVKKAKSVLLHCHPSSDPDSVGSALAMKYVLEGMGKDVTIIQGDSELPAAFLHFPGATEIVKKNFFEINLKDFDLFIIQDSGSKEMISRVKPIRFPLKIKSIVIDHHASNRGYGDINLIVNTYPATCQILFELFHTWKVKITENIAKNLFIGMYTDTGGFKYPGTSTQTFNIAAELVKIIPDFPELISEMENSNEPADLRFQGLALDSIQTFLDGKLALSIIPLASLHERNIPLENVHGDLISPILKTVTEWYITGILVETEPNIIKMSFRSKNSNIYNVSKLAVALGGGGHKAAAGAILNMSIEDAKKLVVEKVNELFFRG